MLQNNYESKICYSFFLEATLQGIEYKKMGSPCIFLFVLFDGQGRPRGHWLYLRLTSVV
jgi:hypothetical protein